MSKYLHTILVVDDEEVILDSFDDIFSRKGYKVITAENGLKALDILKDTVIDLAIVDVKMPKMNGLELLQRMKSSHESIPVILMTGYGSEDTAVEALRLGASNYLKKPFNIMTIADTIEKILYYKVARDRVQKKEILVKKTLESLSSFEFKFPINIESIEGGVIFITDYLFSGSPFKTNVEIGVHEALLNAYYHGSLEVSDSKKDENISDFYNKAANISQKKFIKDKRITLKVNVTEDAYSFTIIDEGKGFDWKEISASVEADLDNKPFGRGVMLIRSFFDVVKWNDKGNEITMILKKDSTKHQHLL
ncbi:response regulator [Thermodesulfobacteriota bacterium]